MRAQREILALVVWLTRFYFRDMRERERESYRMRKSERGRERE